MNSVFSEQILADELSNLNSTQQCIETEQGRAGSRHMGEAIPQVGEDPESSPFVPLQNSKCQGDEFVTEFWKVLPAALKDVSQKGDDGGKNVVSRLVDIWEERRVFGSHAQSVRDLMLGEGVLLPLELNKKRPPSVMLLERDSLSIRPKLIIGSIPEKIVSAFHSVLSEHPNEDSEMSNCMTVVQRVKKMEKDFVVAASTAKYPKRKPLVKELEDDENTLKQYIEKFKSVETTRAALVSQLKEALDEQVAEARVEVAKSMRNRLSDEDFVLKPSTSNSLSTERSTASIAAQVANELAASTSFLSSIAAEEEGLSTSSNSDAGSICDNHLAPGPTHFMPPSSTQQSRVSASQPQYHHIPPTQLVPVTQYLQPPGGIGAPYSFASFPTMSAPLAPGSVVLLSCPAPLTQQQPPVPLAQQPPMALSFQPLPPPGPGDMYYNSLNQPQVNLSFALQ